MIILLIDDIKNRLENLGYTVKESDDVILGLYLEKVENSIKTRCSITEIPSELNQIVADRVFGEFLFYLKSTNNLEGIKFEAAIKEIKDLDTTVVYAVGSDSSEKQFDLLIEGLRTSGEKEFISFRRLRW